MPIAELGYRHWEGTRTSALRRMLAITRSEIAIAYKGSKLLRRFLVFAWMPIMWFCPFFLAVGYMADPSNDLSEGAMLSEIATAFFNREAIEVVRANPELFLPQIWSVAFYVFFYWTQSILAMIVVAIVGPPLIARDLRSKAFLVYFSKPIQPWQYLVGKLATVVFFVFSMTLFPALFLYAVGIALSPDAGTLTATIPIVLKIILSSVMIAVPISMVVLLLSSFTKDRRIATFSWVTVCIFGEIAFWTLTFGGYSANYTPPAWATALSLHELTTQATAGVFGLRGNLQTLFENFGDSGQRVDRAVQEMVVDFGADTTPTISMVVLIGLSALCAFVVLRQVTKPVRI